MLTICSDTHSLDGHALTGRTLEAVREADQVIHAGDFTSTSALDAFQDEAKRLDAVHGNADRMAVRDRLPTARIVEYEGIRFAVTHRKRGGATALSLFGRQREADVVVSGHSHQPSVVDADGLTLLNPGSHADPRGNRPGHAELEPAAGGLDGRLCQPDGTVFEEFRIEP
ncbi:metallophosphoesterase [Natranaeroarchaeum sulfidigenes]|uniref:Phosphoesterase n=1 Tax=Natranaeroarchaeum sulfidigenes TaxID=2784880 RepID=A0A897MLU1_9EURY|nr:metallophosphoesterase [Natranaeroarchaeum sulfidigenes]QSG01584.1 ICC-like phosphoesterase [Natranaeroarchaeum sulfidigenes]